MRVLVVSTPIFKLPCQGYSGLEHLAWLTAKGLAAKGHQVSLVAPDGSECPGVDIIPIGVEKTTNEENAFQIYQHLLDGFDCIIDETWLKFCYKPKIEGLLKIPVLGVLHAPVPTMYQTAPPVDKPCFICISNDQARYCMSHLHHPARVCYNGIDLNFYSPLPVGRTDRYLFLARFSSIKGPHIAIECCLAAGVGLDLVGDTQITGEPELYQRCVELAEKSSPNWNPDKGKQIRIIGGVSRGEAVWWFSRAKALLHPNRHFCHLPGQRVISKRGAVRIEGMSTFDHVLSHDGRWHKVTNVLSRKYSGNIKIIRHSSFSGRLKVTMDHPLYATTPRVCACMGESAGIDCKPTYGGYQRCRELAQLTIEKQNKYDQVVALKRSGKTIKEIAASLSIPETTAYYWSSGKTKRPERDLQMPYCDHYYPEWRPASDIKVGNYLVTPVPGSIDREYITLPNRVGKYEKCQGGYRSYADRRWQGSYDRHFELPECIPLSDAFLSFCGWYLAEGYENRDAVRFALNRDETEHADEIRNLARQVFGKESTIYQAKDAHAQVILVSGRPLGLITKSWFGGNARVKRMPYWLFCLPPEKIKHVIRSAWRGDGCISKSGKYHMLSYTTASPTLAMQLWLCLTKLGIVGYLVEKRASHRAKNAGKIIYNLNVAGEGAARLAEIVGWQIPSTREKRSWQGYSYIHNGLIYSRVTEVSEEYYEGDVHNITVEQSNSYIAQLVASHNCEPFGLAPVEAQACGTPVLAWDNGAMRETIENGRTGYLVESADQMVKHILNDSIADLDRSYCRKWAEQFSVDRMIDRYEELMLEAVNTGGW